MKGPSIAVMLGGHDGAKGEDKDEGDMSLSEAKSSAEDAATAFAGAVKAGDAKRIVKSFGALAELCKHVYDLEESGESDDEEAAETESDGDE